MESETVSKKDVTLDKNAENSGEKPEVAKEEKPSSANLESVRIDPPFLYARIFPSS